MAATTAMQSREIAPDEWGIFLGSISRHYAGRMVEIRLLRPDLGVISIARGLPFIGITFESGPSLPPTIRVIAGDPQGGHVAHDVEYPRRVRIKQEANGVDNAIEIESAGSPTVLIEFAAESPKRI